MWKYEETADTSASAQDVWRVLADLDRWTAWDTSMEWVRLDGPFAVGSVVTMKPIEQDEPIESRIAEIDPGLRYADVTDFGGVLLRFSHTLEPIDGGGTRVTHRLEITGDAADTVGPELGPQIAADFPDALAALLALAESGTITG